MPGILLTALLVLGAVFLFFRIRRAPKADANTLRQPKVMLYTGIVGFLLFGTLLAVLAFSSSLPEDGWIAGTFMLIFLAACFGALLMYANWRVELGEGGFTYYTFLGNERVYSYADILSYSHGADSLIVHMRDGNKLHFERINAGAFMLLLHKALAMPDAAEAIPENRSRFLGAEMQSRRRLVGAVLLVSGLLLFGLGAAFFAFSSTDAPYSRANIRAATIRYENGEITDKNSDHPRFLFKNDKGTAYRVGSLAYDVFAVEDFLNDIRKGDILYLKVPAAQADAGVSPMDAVSIENTEWSYLSMEDVNQRYVENGRLERELGAGLALVSALLMLLTVQMLRHPDRLPRLQRGFFGKDYRSSL